MNLSSFENACTSALGGFATWRERKIKHGGIVTRLLIQRCNFTEFNLLAIFLIIDMSVESDDETSGLLLPRRGVEVSMTFLTIVKH